eukprot:SAG31_NODE_7448_length_1687_cov_1.128463_3_plen_132_part_00
MLRKGVRACNQCVAEVSIEPMFFWLSRGRAAPKSVAELKHAIEKVKELSQHVRMQEWLTSPWKLVCSGGKLIPKPEEVDESALLIREALPLDGLVRGITSVHGILSTVTDLGWFADFRRELAAMVKGYAEA